MSWQAPLVYIKDINRNIPTTWRWARWDLKYEDLNFRTVVLKESQRFLWGVHFHTNTENDISDNWALRKEGMVVRVEFIYVGT